MNKLCVRQVSSFPAFPLLSFRFFFRSFCETAVVSFAFHGNFEREIGARAAKIDLLAHALTHVFPLSWFLHSSKNSFNAFKLMHPKMSKARPN